MAWGVLFVYCICLFFIFCYSIVQLQLVILYKKRKSIPAIELDEEKIPFVTIQLPLYNERYVVERLIESMFGLDYPDEKLQIQILDDSDDETTAIITNRINILNQERNIFELVRRPVREGFKAGALKYGLEKAKGEFVAIFDADFVPNKDFLKKTIPYFYQNEKVGVVQTRWEHLNENYSLLTKIQAFGLDAHFTVEQAGRNSKSHFINFNGTGGVWRKSCILDAGNWESDTLTEDLDLSYRAQLRGWKFVYLENVGAPAELPATMSALKSQQFRWTKGAAENAMKNLKRVFKTSLPLNTKLHATFHLLNSAVFLSVITSAVLSVPLLFLKQDVKEMENLFEIASLFFLSLFVLAGFYGSSFFRFRELSFSNILKFMLMFPTFLTLSMGLSLHNAIAVFEGYIGKKSPFVRTPKFNIINKKDDWKSNVYRLKDVSALTFVEGALALYFLFGLGIGFVKSDYTLVVFHTMLCLGFGSIFIYTLKHNFSK